VFRSRLWRLAASLLPIVTGVLGLRNGRNDARAAMDAGQRLAGWSAVAYGVLGVLAAVGLLLGRRWARPVLAAWGVGLTLAGGLAPVVWGHAPIWTGLLSGLSVALVVTGELWLARRALLPPT
jgi:hypothetical protein